MAEEAFFSKKYLTRLIYPLIAEQFLAMMIGACDTVMVASIGEAAVSGVSLIDQLSQLMIQLFAAFATGGAVVASQYIGHKDDELARRAAKQLLTLSAFTGCFFIIVCMPFRSFILNILYGGVTKEVMSNSMTYFFWILISLPFLAVYNGCAALFRSMGNSRLSLKISLLINLVNILGNAILIMGLKIGVAGAGISTLASRFTSAVLMVTMLCRKKGNIIYLEKIWKPELRFDMIGRILKVAIPSGIENSMFHIGKILVYSFMSGFGIAATSANAITNTIASFSNIPGNAIGLASVTVVGQCIGADRKDEAKKYGRKMMKETYIGMFFACSVILIFAPVIVSIFNLSPTSAWLATTVLRTCMVANMIVWPMSFTLPNILRAAGDVKYTMFVSNISIWLFRVLFSYLISQFLIAKFPDKTYYGLFGIWFGMYIDWIFRAVMFGIRFHGERWLNKKVI